MNVGEYARLNNTLYNTVVILKIMEVFENTILTENDGSIYQGEYGIDEIINHSYNIIDLIEVGDYVNGEKVCYLKGDINDSEVAHKEDVLYTEYNDEYGEWYGYAEDEIETIATKEQFEAIQYKVGKE